MDTPAWQNPIIGIWLCRVCPKKYKINVIWYVVVSSKIILMHFVHTLQPSGLLHCHWGNHMIAPVPVK